MKPVVLPLLIATSLWIATHTVASAQSINRIRQSINNATGGAAGAPGRPQFPPPAPPTLTPEQVAAAQAAQAAQVKRQQENAAAAELKVVAFLKERVDGGSADAAVDLAKRYETGKGVATDPKEARRLYQLAAERDNEEAKSWLKEHPETEKGKRAAATAAVGAKPVSATKAEGAK